MPEEGIIAADATKNDFHDNHPNGFSSISVAIAAGNHDEFNNDYFSIVEEFIDDHGIKAPTPILKDKYINRYIPQWEQKEARRDLVLELLNIDSLDTIYVTETYLEPSWIEMYSEEDDKFRREISHEFNKDILFQYYDIISIWRYLKRYEGRDFTHYNVMTDDFSGQLNKAYQEVGDICGMFRVIPHGDETYPLLSLADLTTGLLKQEVYPLRKDDIVDYIKHDTPAYVGAESVHTGQEHFEKVIPHKSDSLRTDLLYPDPTVYFDYSDMSKKKLQTLDVFSYACMYAQQRGGCVKSFNESSDSLHLSGDDLIICLEETPANYDDYDSLNSRYKASILGRDEALEYLTDNIPGELVL